MEHKEWHHPGEHFVVTVELVTENTDNIPMVFKDMGSLEAWIVFSIFQW